MKDLKNQKAATKNNKVKQTNANKIEHKETKQSQSKKSKEKLKGGGGFQEKFLIFTMFALGGRGARGAVVTLSSLEGVHSAEWA